LYSELETIFHVSGYTDERQQIFYWIHIAGNEISQLNLVDNQGANWDGETDVLTSIINATAVNNEDGKPAIQLPFYPISWEYFSLQDAIDFALFAMSATTGAIRFQN